ncbi:MAG TPA: PHB depolymerase family esterase [Herpetosiphonaceae bacterium]
MKLWKIILLAALVAALFGGRLAARARIPQRALGAEPQTGAITYDGLERSFVFYVPDPAPSRPAPLVMVLHGGGGTAEHAMDVMTEGRWNELADRDGFIVVYPQGVDNLWNDCRADGESSGADDSGFLVALAGYFSRRYPVDASRVYAAGHSNGAMMSQRLALEHPGVFAAVFSNTGPLPALSECAPARGPVSVMFLAGTADPMIPFEGGEVDPPGNGDHGTVLSAAATVAAWTRALSATGAPEVIHVPDIVPGDGSTITISSYTGLGGELRYYQADGGGHGWPSPTQFPPAEQLRKGKKNQDIVACDEAWAFFQRHPRAPLPHRLALPVLGGL